MALTRQARNHNVVYEHYILDNQGSRHTATICDTYAFQPSINPTCHPYVRIMWIHTLGHVGGGNRCGGVPC